MISGSSLVRRKSYYFLTLELNCIRMPLLNAFWAFHIVKDLVSGMSLSQKQSKNGQMGRRLQDSVLVMPYREGRTGVLLPQGNRVESMVCLLVHDKQVNGQTREYELCLAEWNVKSFLLACWHRPDNV